MNSIKSILHTGSRSYKGKLLISRTVLKHFKLQFFCTSTSIKVQNLAEEDDFFKKVVYNEVLQHHRKIKTRRPFETISLKYLMPENNQVEIKNENVETAKEVVHFPYETKQEIVKNNVKQVFSETVDNFTPSDYETVEVPQWKSENYLYRLKNLEKPVRWAFEDIKEEQKNYEWDDVFKFGSCNPNSPVSSIPCGGCGALLHCNDPKLPGFIPAELFENKKQDKLQGEKCQRCHFLKEFNVALGMNVSPSEYKNLISSIKNKKALVIIMIDILDFPCSIFPEIFDLIGSEKPVIIVANKVDLLIQEDTQFEKNFKESVMWALRKRKINLENIKHIELISAKTGYGIENLIDVLHSNWGNKGDIYLVGCTNVGKSSLFNTLIQSDLCKVKAVNLLQRATVAAWPGTTLNLLKFPILKPYKWRLYLRSRRLSNLVKEEKAFKKFQCLGQKISLEQIPLQGMVCRTFLDGMNPDDSGEPDDLSSNVKRKGINPHLQEFAEGFWFYDTPGVVNEDQIVNFLTASELMLTVPKKMLLPRNFHLKPGASLFIAGLARLDYISGADLVWFTVYASMELPITVTNTEDAEEVYEKLLGTPYFRVPISGKERLSKWPNLSSKKFEIIGKIPKFFTKQSKENLNDGQIPKNTDTDIVLSSAGWVSVTVPFGYRCNVEAWTPRGKGIYLRDFPLIKKGYTFRGQKIPKTPAFEVKMKEVTKYSFRKITSAEE